LATVCSLFFLCLFACIGSAQSPSTKQITVDLSDGSKLNGEVISWDGNILNLKTAFGKAILKKSQIATKSLDALAATPATDGASAARIAELEATVESLRRDNAALRAQLSTAPTSAVAQPMQAKTAAPSGAGGASGAITAPTASDGGAPATGYWITGTGKRHNPNCRYFKTTKGRDGTAAEGTPCKACGG
jgi:hypothetical protein